MGHAWDVAAVYRELSFQIFSLIFSELIVDWFKHAFVIRSVADKEEGPRCAPGRPFLSPAERDTPFLRFNNLTPELYAKYLHVLYRDVASPPRPGAVTGHSTQIFRRLSFAPMPLVCFLGCSVVKRLPTWWGWHHGLVLVLFMCAAVLLKVGLGPWLRLVFRGASR